MGLLDKILGEDTVSKVNNMTIKDPAEVFKDILRKASGSTYAREIKYSIFYKIIAFRGVTEGLGTSTIVANVALACAQMGLTVCVVDTSILHPTQDVLLNTNYITNDIEPKDRLDWFDMPYTKRSPLHVSSYDKSISVLSFYGKERGITDILSTNDNASLVEIAFSVLNDKFDIILVDSCHELTSVNTTALQMSQKVIQVWGDSSSVVNNIDGFITNNVTLSCPLDKMRYVVYSKTIPDVIGNTDNLLKEYRLTKLTEFPLSVDVARVGKLGKKLWNYVSESPDIEEYQRGIIFMTGHILNIDLEDEEKGTKQAKGTITSQQIMDGEVEGTVTKKLKDRQEALDIATDLKTADEQLKGKKVKGKKKKQRGKNKEESSDIILDDDDEIIE